MTNKTINILMTTDTVGGVWTYSMELCRAMQPYNVFFSVVSLGEYPSKAQLEEVKKTTNIQLFPTNYKLEWMQNPWKDLYRTRKKLSYLYSALKPDLFHFNNFIQKEKKWNRPSATVYHSCVQSWWKAVNGCKPPVEWDNYKRLVKKALDTTDRIIFPSDSIRKEALDIYDLNGNAEVIFNGRNLENNSSESKENFILCCGRIWDEAKNLSVLCEIASEIEWPVYVAGDSRPPKGNKDVSLKNIRFLGKLDAREMEYWFSRASIYVNPAKYEPFGLAVLEAASAGCALVLSSISTLHELWRDNALFFDPDKPSDLKQKLQFLINNKNQREDFQQKAQSASKRFSLENFAENYKNLYVDLLNKNTTSSFLKKLSL